MIRIKSVVRSVCTILYELSVLYYKWDNGINEILCALSLYLWHTYLRFGSGSCWESIAVKEVLLNNVHYIPGGEPALFLCITTRSHLPSSGFSI